MGDSDVDSEVRRDSVSRSTEFQELIEVTQTSSGSRTGEEDLHQHSP